MKINIFWFRRDLRLEDNTGLYKSLNSGFPVLPVYIFDTNITDDLPPDDPRISFMYKSISLINIDLQKSGSSILILKGDPEKIWKKLLASYEINAVYVNKDYEPYSIRRDNKIEILLQRHQIQFLRFKDQVIFEEKEILKSDGNPYTIFTPYKNKWLNIIADGQHLKNLNKSEETRNYYKNSLSFPSTGDLGFRESAIKVRPFDLSVISNYDKYRDFPSDDRTSYLGPHLRFGTVSIRSIVQVAIKENAVFLSELIWREFFMQILFNFQYVEDDNFKSKYDEIEWRNNEKEFEKWCNGKTGYPIVDAGMNQLNETGFMHNRVRMITAGFLCKHLLIDWRWGEAYFAGKLLDYELASNNGNWQWAAGTGCDAAPYFRVFNPYTQQKKFDRNNLYIKKWGYSITNGNPPPIVDHVFARTRAIETYRTGLKRSLKK